jgi:hypothetical protein
MHELHWLWVSRLRVNFRRVHSEFLGRSMSYSGGVRKDLGGLAQTLMKLRPTGTNR